MTVNLEYVEETGKLREPIVFPLRIRGAQVASTKFEHFQIEEKLNVKAELQSHLGPTVLGLVTLACAETRAYPTVAVSLHIGSNAFFQNLIQALK